ncbi:hypothetical protein FB562_1032 [Homoserinimonas aerilata]|uniref:Transcriptional regulator with AbiEi antitoxin domain of type IV toxin-antitoxin system n=1 Tax=Homoserinimonas aerilata TaxID=1162970 RepID=A0A542YIP0_9MICO|nr:hypothetical protein [Homoserinimonas aerilata]TQL47953.1 hypothetical protein FB562_1032 [Homoserinimonas aerilata]
MASRLSPVLSALDLPWEELQAARLDGEVFAIDDCFSPIDEFERGTHRGMSLAATVSHKLIAERRTAAWIHGARANPPVVHQLCVSLSARAHVPWNPRIAVREVVITAEEILSIGGFAVTTPMRTVLDYLRTSAEFDEDDATEVRALMQLARLDPATCREQIASRRNLPGKQRALQRLMTLESTVRS